MDAEELWRAPLEDDVMDASVTDAGERGWAPSDVAENSGVSLRGQGARCRAGDLHLASVTDGEVVKAHAWRRNPDLKSRLGATQFSAAERVGAAEDGGR